MVAKMGDTWPMNTRSRILYGIIIAQGLIAMAGSLIFSNYLGYAPCDLCWYQRICMYPLAVIGIVALARKDQNAVWYGLPLSLMGLGISLWHNTEYFLVNNAKVDVTVPCSVSGISCTTKYFEFAGFISIPQLSLFAFVVTTIAFFLLAKHAKR